MIEAGEAAELSEYIKENNPIDVAQAAEYLDDDELWKMCSILSSDDIASVLEQADDELSCSFYIMHCLIMNFLKSLVIWHRMISPILLEI